MREGNREESGREKGWMRERERKGEIEREKGRETEWGEREKGVEKGREEEGDKSNISHFILQNTDYKVSTVLLWKIGYNLQKINVK